MIGVPAAPTFRVQLQFDDHLGCRGNLPHRQPEPIESGKRVAGNGCRARPSPNGARSRLWNSSGCGLRLGVAARESHEHWEHVVDSHEFCLPNDLEISGERPPERSEEGWSSAAFPC